MISGSPITNQFIVRSMPGCTWIQRMLGGSEVMQAMAYQKATHTSDRSPKADSIKNAKTRNDEKELRSRGSEEDQKLRTRSFSTESFGSLYCRTGYL
jgi:hypothetical protein